MLPVLLLALSLAGISAPEAALAPNPGPGAPGGACTQHCDELGCYLVYTVITNTGVDIVASDSYGPDDPDGLAAAMKKHGCTNKGLTSNPDSY